MRKKWVARFVDLFDPAGVRKFITQISLILISLLLATRAERCRESGKDREKLRDYLTAIQTDLEDEIKTDRMNLNDSNRDVRCLVQFLTKAGHSHTDSLLAAYSNFAEVYQRGVFRAFPPTTFDLMVQSGDANLLKDLHLRNSLASVFAFRQNVVRKDLQDFDLQTQVCAEKLGRFFDLSLMFAEGEGKFLLDKEGFLRDPHNEVFLLLRNANLRAFHLENALEDLQATQQELDAYLKKL
jgi:hypothetical protein